MSETSALAITIASAIFVVVAAFLLARRFTGKAGSVASGTPEAFARLLVAEIALFHGKSIDSARSQSAIYRLFKDDIDRSRQMFLKRFPQSESVFYATLVSVLAHGKPEALGTDYPHSRSGTSPT